MVAEFSSCEVPGHTFGEGDEDTLVVGGTVADLGEDVVDLALYGTDF